MDVLSEDNLRNIIYGNKFNYFWKDAIANISDPEFPDKTLEDLDIVDSNKITMRKKERFFDILIVWKPTVKTCKYAENIGLAMRYSLLYDEYLINYKGMLKITFVIEEDGHNNKEDSKYLFFNYVWKVDKKVNDKERYSAAFENDILCSHIKQFFK